MSDIYEILVDGDLRVVIYDDVRLASRIYLDMVYAVASPDNLSFREAAEKIILLCNGALAV